MRPILLLAFVPQLAFAVQNPVQVVVDCDDGPYYTLQDGIDAADLIKAGNQYTTPALIEVHPCTYNETIELGRLQDFYYLIAADDNGVNMGAAIGGPRTPLSSAVIIDGSGSPGACIRMQNNAFAWVIGFRLENCTTGFDLESTAFNGFAANEVINASGYAMYEYHNDYTRWFDNTFDGGTGGAYTDDFGSYDQFIDNRFGRTSGVGFELDGCYHRLINNVVGRNDDAAITVRGCYHTLLRNTFRGSNLAGTPGVADLMIMPESEYTVAVGNKTQSLIDLGYVTGEAENYWP